MCGIAGIVSSTDHPNYLEQIIRHMTRLLAHRGPDEEGFFFDTNTNVAFGHRRLSVIDLDLGHQPMEVARYVIILNGEIYN